MGVLCKDMPQIEKDDYPNHNLSSVAMALNLQWITLMLTI